MLEFISLAIIRAGDTACVGSPWVIAKQALSSLRMPPPAAGGRQSNYRELLSSFTDGNKLNGSQRQRSRSSFCCFCIVFCFFPFARASPPSRVLSPPPCTLAALSAKSPPSGGVGLAPGSCKQRDQTENPNLHAKRKRSNTCLPAPLSSVDGDDRVDSSVDVSRINLQLSPFQRYGKAFSKHVELPPWGRAFSATFGKVFLKDGKICMNKCADKQICSTSRLGVFSFSFFG